MSAVENTLRQEIVAKDKRIQNLNKIIELLESKLPNNNELAVQDLREIYLNIKRTQSFISILLQGIESIDTKVSNIEENLDAFALDNGIPMDELDAMSNEVLDEAQTDVRDELDL